MFQVRDQNMKKHSLLTNQCLGNVIIIHRRSWCLDHERLLLSSFKFLSCQNQLICYKRDWHSSLWLVSLIRYETTLIYFLIFIFWFNLKSISHCWGCSKQNEAETVHINLMEYTSTLRSTRALPMAQWYCKPMKLSIHAVCDSFFPPALLLAFGSRNRVAISLDNIFFTDLHL